MIDQDVRTMILGAIEARNSKNQEDKGALPVRASSMGQCPRAIGLELTGTPVQREISATSLSIMGVGSSWHSVIQEAMVAAYPGTIAEMDVMAPLVGANRYAATDVATWLNQKTQQLGYPEVGFRGGISGRNFAVMIPGHIDLVVATPSRKWEVWEIKSKSGFGFTRLEKEGADPAHVAQAMAYHTAMTHASRVPETAPFQGDSFVIVYVNRDSGDTKPLRFRADDPDVLRIYKDASAAMVEAIEGAMDGRVTETSFARGLGPRKLPWQCNYCKFGPVVGACVREGTLVNKGTAAKPSFVVI